MPYMEYACVVWNSHAVKDCALFDAVQNQAVKWIMKSHREPVTLKWTKSSGNCVSDLSWPSLATIRVFLTCLLPFHVFHGHVVTVTVPYLLLLHT